MNIGRTAAALLAVSLLASAGCATQAPVNARPTADSDIGRFVWQDLMTDDVDGAIAFYGGLLGWDFEESERLGSRYVLVRSNGAYIAGIAEVERDDPGEPIAQWLSFLSVPDVDIAAAQVAAAGGEVLADPIDLATSRVAVVSDPQGALLGLVELPSQLNADSAQSLTSDSFIWRDYLADNVDEALAFYADVAGFTHERVPRDDDQVHYVLHRGEPRAGLFGIGDQPVEPNWIVYVKVDDPASLARRVAQLGGQVILAPDGDLRSGSLAIVADPSGAALGLQQWPIDDPEDR